MGFFKIDKKKWARYSMIPGAADAPAYGDTQLGKALTKAAATLDAKEQAGKMKPANATAFRGRIDGLVPLIGKDEDTGLLQIAQIIGSINRSA